MCHHQAIVNRPALDAQPPVPSVRRLLGGPLSRWPRAADAVLAVVVLLVIVLVAPGPDDELALRAVDEVSIAELLVLAVASGVLYWRRSRPLVVFGVTLVAAALSTGLGWSELDGIVMLVALYSVGRYATDLRSYVGWVPRSCSWRSAPASMRWRRRRSGLASC